jgi:hypothetical protein
MCAKLNELLLDCGAGFSLSYDDIKDRTDRGSVRERHLAKAFVLKLKRRLRQPELQKLAFYEKLFGGKALKSRTRRFCCR